MPDAADPHRPGNPPIHVVGAGIMGLWQAVTLSAKGWRVRLSDASPKPFETNASRLAGAMLAPRCEAADGDKVLEALGLEGLAAWNATLPEVLLKKGSLVVALPRDRSELDRFAQQTLGHALIEGHELAKLEPGLQPQFARALHFAEEACMEPKRAMNALLELARSQGVAVTFGVPTVGVPWHAQAQNAAGDGPREITIDCRGMGAKADVPTLRGVRGERLILHAPNVNLTRVVRLLHPRYPIYVVPWGQSRYMVGATVIERDDAGPPTVRSALELLGAAYAIDPGFAEAEIEDVSAGVRPAFPDNRPHVLVKSAPEPGSTTITVNGAYRHGYLLAPVMAAAVADYLTTGAIRAQIIEEVGT